MKTATVAGKKADPCGLLVIPMPLPTNSPAKCQVPLPTNSPAKCQVSLPTNSPAKCQVPLPTNATKIDMPEIPKLPAKVIQQKGKPKKTCLEITRMVAVKLMELVSFICLWIFFYQILLAAMYYLFRLNVYPQYQLITKQAEMDVDVTNLELDARYRAMETELAELKNSWNNLEQQTKEQELNLGYLYNKFFHTNAFKGSPPQFVIKLEDGKTKWEQKYSDSPVEYQEQKDEVKNSDILVEFRLPENQEQKDGVKNSDSPVEFRLPEYQDEEGSGLRV